jgi:hypothetical protein
LIRGLAIWVVEGSEFALYALAMGIAKSNPQVIMPPVDLQAAGFVTSEEPDGPTRSAGRLGEVRRTRRAIG